MNHKAWLKASSILALFGAGVLAPTVAAAQDAAKPADDGKLETIIVTAQKRSINVQDSPLAISAITGAALAKDRVTSVVDLAQTMTGISFTANSPQANEINIRGVVNTRLTSPTADQSVSTFVDDVYVARSGIVNTNFMDIARVEVVRGPQGVLLGKNVAGGAVNIISNRPSATTSGAVSASIGDYALRQFSGFINGAVAQDLNARVSFQSYKHAGYAKDLLHHTDLEDADSIQARAQLAWEPAGAGFKALLIADYSQYSDNGVNRVGIVSPTVATGATIWSGTRNLISAALGRPLTARESYPVWPTFAGDAAPSPQSATRDNYSLVLRMEKQMGDATLTSITGYRHNKSYTLYDQTGLGPYFTVLPPGGVADGGFNLTPAQLASVGSSLLFAEPVNFAEQGTYFTQELRAASADNGSKFSWIFGGFFLSSKVHQFNRYWGQSLVLATLSGESHWDDTGHNQDVAVFGQVGYKFTDTLKLDAGIRYTHDRKYGVQQGIITATGDIYHPADAAPLTPLTENFTAPYGAAWNDVTPQATLTWKPNPAMMAYATVSRGFKGGGFQNSASKAVAAAAPYNPETVTNYEIGFKSEFFGHTLRWNSALFMEKYKNLQVQQTLASCLCNVISNAASATIKGIESDIQFAPSRQFRAWLSGSYLDARYDDFTFAGVNNSGNQMQRTPKYQLAVGAEASLDLGADWKNGLTARLAYRYQGRMPWAPENLNWEDAYGTLDGRVTLTMPNGNWSLSAFGKNLGNTLYRTNIIVFFRDEMSSYAPPRTYGFELSAKF